MIEEIAQIILDARQGTPLRVGIDGVDAAGKTHLANELAAILRERGYPVLRASIDGFHNPRQMRYQRGSYSPEGYYYDSFNYEWLVECLLKPLEPAHEGPRVCRLTAFDFKTDEENLGPEVGVSEEHILIFEGVFLFRPELREYWDLKIFVEVSFQTSLERALQRDGYLFGEREEILRKYQQRYIPGQKIYLESVRPQALADIIIDNHDYSRPVMTTRMKRA